LDKINEWLAKLDGYHDQSNPNVRKERATLEALKADAVKIHRKWLNAQRRNLRLHNP